MNQRNRVDLIPFLFINPVSRRIFEDVIKDEVEQLWDRIETRHHFGRLFQ
ncbi:unnamed protein product [Prunus brigantina]